MESARIFQILLIVPIVICLFLDSSWSRTRDQAFLFLQAKVLLFFFFLTLDTLQKEGFLHQAKFKRPKLYVIHLLSLYLIIYATA